MNKIIKLSSISIATAFLLHGCQDGDRYNASANSTDDALTPNKYVQKDGLSGAVIADTYIEGATVCLDMNSDGICQNTEPTEKTYENGKYSFSKFKTDFAKDAHIVANVNNQYILTAPADSSNGVISPFTTITNNEIMYNPYANAKAEDAISDIRAESSLFTEVNLKGENYLSANPNLINTDSKAIIESLKTAYSLKTSAPLDTIANVVDEMIKNNNLSVNVTTINEQKRVDKIFSLTLGSKTLNIDSQDNNQRAVGAKSHDNKTVVHSKWNNRLTLINSNESKVAVSNYLAGANGDTTSGPSEKILSKMLLNDDSLYSLVKKDKAENGNNGLGIYRSNFNYSSVPSLAYNSLGAGASNYYKHDYFSDFALSSDDSKLLASSTDNKIYIFNSKNFSAPLNTITAENSVDAITYSSDDNNYFAAYSNSVNVHKSSDNLKLSSLLLNKKIKQLIPVNANELLVSYDADKTVSLIDTSNLSSLSVKRTYTNDSTTNINKINISPDKKSFIVSFVNSKKVTAHYIDSNTSVNSSLDLLKNANDIIYTEDKRLLAVSDFIAYYLNIRGDGAELTPAQKTTWRNNHRR